MRSSKTLFAAILLASLLWLYFETRLPAQRPTSPQDTTTAKPADKKTGTASTSPHVRSGPPFNVVRDKAVEVRNDLAIADALGIRPIKIGSKSKDKDGKERDWTYYVCPKGEKFKWVLTRPPESELWAVPILDLRRPLPLPLSNNGNPIPALYPGGEDIIKHIIVTRGMPVQTAGEAWYEGDELVIDNHSGHYQPNPESVTLYALKAFQELGIKVRIQARSK